MQKICLFILAGVLMYSTIVGSAIAKNGKPEGKPTGWVTALVDLSWQKAHKSMAKRAFHKLQDKSIVDIANAGTLIKAMQISEYPAATLLVRVPAGRAKALSRLPFVENVIIKGIDDYQGRIKDSINVAIQVAGEASSSQQQSTSIKHTIAAVGGVLTYESESSGLLMADIPVDQVGIFENDPRISHFSLDRPIEGSMASANANIGNSPFYWPSGSGTSRWHAVVIDSGLYINSIAFASDKIAYEWGRCRTNQSNGCRDGADPDKQASRYEYGFGSSDPSNDIASSGVKRHGTLMAAALGGNSTRDLANLGVAAHSGLRIIPYRTDYRFNNVMAALDEVAIHVENTGAEPLIAVVNLSLRLLSPTDGYCDGRHAAFESIVSRLFRKNVPIVAAAGNYEPNRGEPSSWERRIDYPACLSQVISVGASTDANKPVLIDPNDPDRFWAAQTDETLGLFAPGFDIRTTYGSVASHESGGSSYSTAIASGVFAKLKVKYPKSSPTGLLYRIQVGCPRIYDSRVKRSIPKLCVP